MTLELNGYTAVDLYDELIGPTGSPDPTPGRCLSGFNLSPMKNSANGWMRSIQP